MSDLSNVIKPKSDQLNADDLVSGDMTIRIRDVKVNQTAREQPVSIFFDGDNGKPWKPCKTMARALTQIWGTCDSQQFVGRSVTLYNDPNVTWAGVKVGGIRIRAASHIDNPMEIAVSQAKGKRSLMRIGALNPEQVQHKQADDAADKFAAQTIAAIERAPDLEKLDGFIATRQAKIAQLAEVRPDLWQRIDDTLNLRRTELTPHEGRADEQYGDQFSDDGEEKPAWWPLVEGIKANAADAGNLAAVKALDTEFQRISAGLPDEVRAEVEAVLGEARKRVRGA